MTEDYHIFADSLTDNSQADNLSEAVCQDLRRYSSDFTEEREAQVY